MSALLQEDGFLCLYSGRDHLKALPSILSMLLGKNLLNGRGTFMTSPMVMSSRIWK